MQRQVGETRQFSFSDKTYVISEIIKNPKIELNWTYDSGICPHCKRKISKDVLYTFDSIEILTTKDVKTPLSDDIEIIGHSVDNRIIRFPKYKFIEVLKQSEKFKEVK